MKKAEERMYRDKLLERTFFPEYVHRYDAGDAAQELQEPKDHIDRMNNLSTMLGKAPILVIMIWRS